jgi:hypothetical protein
MVAEVEAADPSQAEEIDDESEALAPPSQSERAAIIEALIFVSEEPLSIKSIAGVLKEDRDAVGETVAALARSLMDAMADFSYEKLRVAGSLLPGQNTMNTFDVYYERVPAQN